MGEVGYDRAIKDGIKALKTEYRKTIVSMDALCGIMKLLYKAMYGRLHVELVKNRSEAAEKERISICGLARTVVLPKLHELIKNCNKGVYKYDIEKLLLLYDDYYAIVAYRDVEYFAKYTDFDRDKASKLWTYTDNCFKGLWYYFNEMALNKEENYNFLEKQLPTGYGKSMSDNVMISWLFGVDKDTDVLKVFGAKANINPAADAITSIMISSRYSKVFPYYAKFEGKKTEMFEYCRNGQSGFEMKISGSTKSRNLLIVSKVTDINGVRARWLFLDDITQAGDMENIRAHESDIYKYLNEWKRRNYNLYEFKIVAGGTTYHFADILSFLNLHFGRNIAVTSKINKYTAVSKSDYLCSGGISVFVCVPKLDYDTDESTYPSKFPTDQAKAEREDNFRAFMAMEQQQPLPPEGNPFYWDNMNRYTDIPSTRESFTRVAIDLPRTGANHFCMGVFVRVKQKNKFGQPVENDFLIDGIYRKVAMDKVNENGQTVLDEAVDMMIRHFTREMVVENNVESTIGTTFEKLFAAKNYSACKVFTKYTTENKEEKIFKNQTNIQTRIVIPDKKVYSPRSEMGKFLVDLTSWNPKMKDDDPPDMLSIYSEKFIKSGKQKPSIRLLYR